MERSSSHALLNQSRNSQQSTEKQNVNRFVPNLMDLLQSARDKGTIAKKPKGQPSAGGAANQVDQSGSRKGKSSKTGLRHGESPTAGPHYYQQGYPVGQPPGIRPEVQLTMLIEEALRVVHVPRDLSHIPPLKNVLDNHTDHERENNSLDSLGLNLQELKTKISGYERSKYEKVLKHNLTVLCQALDVHHAESFIDSCPSMEEIAIEIRKRLVQVRPPKTPDTSQRLMRGDTMHTHVNEDHDELTRDNKRLKELVVKLQYEINENLKKQSDQRIRELYEDNQNHQRTIADLIDQLKRKEQEILLIPVGKIAQSRIDALELEKAALLKEVEDLKRKLAEALAETQNTIILNANGRKTDFTPLIEPDIHLDPYMMQTVREQKSVIESLTELVTNLRDEREHFEKSVRSLEKKGTDMERITRVFEGFLSTEGYDPRAIVGKLTSGFDDPGFASQLNGSTEAFKEKSELLQLQAQLEKLKKDMNKSTVSGTHH